MECQLTELTLAFHPRELVSDEVQCTCCNLCSRVLCTRSLIPMAGDRLLCRVFFGFVIMSIIFLLYWSIITHPSSNPSSSEWLSVILPLASETNVNCTYSQPENRTNAITSTPDIWFSTFLLILVPIRPSDKDSRQLIRDTWFEGLKNSQDAALRFIVGTKAIESDEQVKLTEENGTFGDIIFVDTKEDFSARTNKTLALINWAHHHVKFSYLFKCDYETYVFVKNVIVELKKRPTTTKLYYGIMTVNKKPIRGKAKGADNKWHLTPMYLPFALGGGYILSHDLVSFLSQESSHLMQHVNEDTAIGAWVSAFDHERRSDKTFCMWQKDNAKLPDCNDDLIVALLLQNHNKEEVKDHFHYFHEHSNNERKIVLEYINSKMGVHQKR